MTVDKYVLVTFVTLNQFFPLSQNLPPTPALNGQYQNGKNINHNKMKNKCPFSSFEVTIKIC